MDATVKVNHPKILGYSVPGYLLVAASAWLSRLLTTAISFATIRILLSTLGVEHYASYTVLMGTVGWFVLADIGTGQSLQNYISESRAAKQEYGQYILSTAAIMLVVVILGIATVVILGGWPASHLLSQFDYISDKEKYLAFVTIAGLTMLTVGGSLVYRIWYAEHKGYLANISATLAAVTALGGIYCIALLDIENKLFWYLFVVNAPMMILSIGCLLARVCATTRVSVLSIRESGIKILKRGKGFWFFNIAVATVFQIDYIVLSQFVAADQIVVYNIGTKIFALAGFMFSAVHQAFWPVCAEAVIVGDWGRIRSFTIKYLKWGMALLVMFTAGIAMFNVRIISLFSSHDQIAMPTAFVVSLGLLYIIRLWTDVFAVILQSMNDLKILLVWALLQAVIGLILQLLLVPKYGIYGTVAALCLSWMVTVSWVLPARVWYLNKKAMERLI